MSLFRGDPPYELARETAPICGSPGPIPGRACAKLPGHPGQHGDPWGEWA